MAQKDGSINETGRKGQPRADLAKMLQAVFGAAHYRQLNYLLKWDPARLDALASDLEGQAALVRRAAELVRERHAVLAYYQPQASPILDSPVVLLDPRLMAALASPSPLGQLARLVDEETPYAYSFPLMDAASCNAILQRVHEYVGWDRNNMRTNENSGFNRLHVPLSACKLGTLADTLLQHVLRPLAALLFPFVAGDRKAVSTSAGAQYGNAGEGGVHAKGGLDFQYSYVIGYSDESTVAMAAAESTSAEAGSVDPLLARSRLVPHTDDSEVTLNLCLGEEFEGGELVLGGLRNSDQEGSEEAVIRHTPGRAVLHLGQHLHEVRPVTSGKRYVLIVWARNEQYRSGVCPCCLIHRRKQSCICDASWN